MRKQQNRTERGQALVLIILAIVGMLGFAALAVDFGRVFAERRRAQNAADAAALAAAMAGTQGNDYLAAAMDQLDLNDYTDAEPNLENTDQKADVEVYSPPASGVYQGVAGYYQVIIHSSVDQIFSQIVYSGQLRITVEAVVEAANAAGIFDGDALHAVSKTSCGALRFDGSGNVRVRHGNVYSDSVAGSGADCTPGDIEGAESCTSGALTGGGDVILDDGYHVITVGPFRKQGSGSIYTVDIHENVVSTNLDEIVQQCQPQPPLPSLPEPACDPTVQTYSKDPKAEEIILQPGTYPDGIKIVSPKANVHMEPGLYCLGSDLSISGGVLTGDEVMFYMGAGSVLITGDTSVSLQAVTDSQDMNHDDNPGPFPPSFGAVDKEDYQWGGMLIYMPPENLGEVHIGGGSASWYAGTIFAPGPRSTEGQDKCIIEGNGDSIGVASSVICYTIKVAGKAQLNINYKDIYNFHLPPQINMSQ